MPAEPHLNIYVVGAGLTPRQRQRIQAQLQTALRSLPAWAFGLLRRRLQELGGTSLPLIVEPRADDEGGTQALGLGHIDGRPAARLMPRLREDGIDWRQDQRYLIAKALAYVAAPPASDGDSWARWSRAVEADRLREKAKGVDAHWAEASDLSLLMEMFAAYALNPEDHRWSELPAVRAFLDGWRQDAVDP